MTLYIIMYMCMYLVSTRSCKWYITYARTCTRHVSGCGCTNICMLLVNNSQITPQCKHAMPCTCIRISTVQILYRYTCMLKLCRLAYTVPIDQVHGGIQVGLIVLSFLWFHSWPHHAISMIQYREQVRTKPYKHARLARGHTIIAANASNHTNSVSYTYIDHESI